MKERKKIKSLCFFIFIIIYLECVYKHFVFDNLFTFDTLRIVFFSISISLCFYLITNIFNVKFNKILSIVLLGFITLLFGAQFIYYKFYNSIFSVFSLKNGTGQVLGFFDAIIDMMGRNILGLIFIFIPFLFFAIFNKKFDFKRMKTKNIIIIVVIMLVSYALTWMFIFINITGIYSLRTLYLDNHAPIITVNKMGLMTMERLDLKRFIFGFNEKLNVDNKKEKEEIIEELEYNIIEIDFDKLILEEENETIKNMHKYFKNSTPSAKNKYTGIFKDKNLIFITAESFDTIAIDKKLTPTLYKLANNSFVFNNFYQPLFTVSTSDGEYMNMTSLIPKEGVWSFTESSNIYMPYALGNMFNKLGYTSNAWHNHSYSYYKRNLSHPNMGFKYVGCGNGLEKLINCRQWPESDLEMIDATINNYINEEKFLTYYMTVSGHLNYTFTGNMMAYKNRKLVSDLPYSDKVKGYLATNIEFDRAMEKLLNYLEEVGKLDDTVIVISPDHYPYGLKIDEINEISKINRNDKFELFHTTLIIYNTEIKRTEIDKYASSIDILPTIYNLFGVEFDSRLLMGKDLLNENDGLVMLSDRSWINENGSYDSITGIFTPFKENITDEYVNNINNLVYEKFTISSLILSKNKNKYIDYYRKLGI